MKNKTIKLGNLKGKEKEDDKMRNEEKNKTKIKVNVKTGERGIRKTRNDKTKKCEQYKTIKG